MYQMKKSILYSAIMSSVAYTATAGEMPLVQESQAADQPFADAIVPLTNPTLAELALPQTKVHGIFMRQSLPTNVSIGGGASAPLGGDLNVFAVQFEYALCERFSIVAAKDGYIDFNPDNTLSEQTGFANIGAGVKYAFHYDPANKSVASVIATVELPTGNRDVFQGYGDGAVNLIVSGLKLQDKWQFSGSAGVHLPFDTDAESVTGFASAHVSYRLTEKITPVFEVNWYRVLSEGNGTETPISGLDFEGGDLINLGSANASLNKDLITAAVGVRYKLNDSVSLGAAYEVPLTDEEDSLMDSRFTFDVVWKF